MPLYKTTNTYDSNGVTTGKLSSGDWLATYKGFVAFGISEDAAIEQLSIALNEASNELMALCDKVPVTTNKSP